MAKTQTLPEITLSDKAPAEPVSFNFAVAQFELVGKKKYETDDADTLAAAEAHDWLSVSYPVVEAHAGAYREQLAAEDDPFTALGSGVNPNDPAEAAAAEEAKLSGEPIHLAIDVSETQTEVVTIGDDIATTLAADPTSKTSSNVKDTN